MNEGGGGQLSQYMKDVYEVEIAQLNHLNE